MTSTDETIVSTQYGPVRGERHTTLTGLSVYTFRGIPYGRPPIGKLRFCDPQPPAAWSKPRDCTAPIRAAPSLGVNAFSEDCLHVTVHTKHLDAGRKQPVMVWLHGGAFKSGSSSDEEYGPDFLLRRDVVLVTVNYRLGALGFLSLNAPAAGVPGNAGLKDQTLALRWVRRNIDAFGGDAANVTVFGNSAGACAVHLHMLSEHSAGAFDRAIAQSGNALAEWANYPRNNWAARLALALGYRGHRRDDEGVLRHLRTASVHEILMQQDAILTEDEQWDGMSTFGPCREPYESEQCFMPATPVEMAARERPWSARVPLMIGGNANEGLLFYGIIDRAAAFYQCLDGFERAVPFVMNIARGSERSLQLARRIRSEYYGTDVPSRADVMRTVELWADRIFWHGIGQAVRARRRTSAEAATFVYRFAVESERFNWHRTKFAPGKKGTSHVDEVVYLFRHPELLELPAEACAELVAVKRMVDMWTNFATNGNPNSDSIETKWEPIGDDGRPLKCLNITDTLEFIDLPGNERIAFWDSLFEENMPTGYIS